MKTSNSIYFLGQVSLYYWHGLRKWVTIHDWSPAGFNRSHSQIYFSIITAFLGMAGMTYISYFNISTWQIRCWKLIHFTCLYALGMFVSVPKNLDSGEWFYDVFMHEIEEVSAILIQSNTLEIENDGYQSSFRWLKRQK